MLVREVVRDGLVVAVHPSGHLHLDGDMAKFWVWLFSPMLPGTLFLGP